MKRFSSILFIIGILFVIGTAGALENDSIGLLQVFIQAFGGVVLAIIGATLMK